jgi:hypothetical protein
MVVGALCGAAPGRALFAVMFAASVFAAADWSIGLLVARFLHNP